MFISSLKKHLSLFYFIFHFSKGTQNRFKPFILLALIFGTFSNGYSQILPFRYQNAGAFSNLIYDTAHLIISPEAGSREGYFVVRLYKDLLNARVEKMLVDTFEHPLRSKVGLRLNDALYNVHSLTHSVKRNKILSYQFIDSLRFNMAGGVAKPADTFIDMDIELLKDTTHSTTLYMNIRINGEINYFEKVRPTTRQKDGRINLGLEYIKHPVQKLIQKQFSIDEVMLENIIQSTSKIRINEDDQFYYLYFVLVR